MVAPPEVRLGSLAIPNSASRRSQRLAPARFGDAAATPTSAQDPGSEAGSGSEQYAAGAAAARPGAPGPLWPLGAGGTAVQQRFPPGSGLALPQQPQGAPPHSQPGAPQPMLAPQQQYGTIVAPPGGLAMPWGLPMPGYQQPATASVPQQALAGSYVTLQQYPQPPPAAHTSAALLAAPPPELPPDAGMHQPPSQPGGAPHILALPPGAQFVQLVQLTPGGPTVALPLDHNMQLVQQPLQGSEHGVPLFAAPAHSG